MDYYLHKEGAVWCWSKLEKRMETTAEVWEVQHRVIRTSHKFEAEETAVGHSKAYTIIYMKT